MLITYRTKPLNYKEVLDNIVNTLCDYLVKSNIKTVVNGLSGGLDSTVTSALLRIVCDKIGIQLHGLSLPCSTNKEDEVDGAKLAGTEFCNQFIEYNIQNLYEATQKACNKTSAMLPTNISQGNIKARIRMNLLYDYAGQHRGIVIDNDMLTEHYLGFMTVNGDVGDISPLANLWKTEVYELANYLYNNVFKGSKALLHAMEITPTDGNGVSNSDLDQIMPGYTYYDVDKILMPWVGLDERIKEDFIKNDFENVKGTVFEKIVEKYGKDNVKRVIMRSVKSEFKRYPHPIPIDMFRGEIVKHY